MHDEEQGGEREIERLRGREGGRACGGGGREGKGVMAEA